MEVCASGGQRRERRWGVVEGVRSGGDRGKKKKSKHASEGEEKGAEERGQ